MTRFPQFSLLFFGADTGDRGPGKYDLLLQSSQFADRAGFTAVWVPERHFQKFGGLYGSPSVAGAAIAALTHRIEIRAGSVVLPLQNVLRVAEEWAMIDNLSGGRVALSIASGWHVNDFVLAPENFGNRYEDMYKKIDLLVRLWRGESVSVPNGAGKMVDVSILPKPLQANLRLWLTCMSELSFRKAGECGFHVLTSNFTHKDVDTLRRCIAVYRDMIRERHHRDGHITLMSHTYVGGSQKDVKEYALPAMVQYILTSTDMVAALGRGGGESNWGKRFGEMTAHEREYAANFGARKILGSELTFIGTMSECERKAIFLRELGIDEIACLIDFGIPLAEVLHSLERTTQFIEPEPGPGR